MISITNVDMINIGNAFSPVSFLIGQIKAQIQFQKNKTTK
jgi:hypothetical protein